MERVVTVRLDSICGFTKATPFSRNMIEGQRVINSRMIVMCGATVKTEEKVELYALVLKSTLTMEPHVITGTLLIQSVDNDYIDDEDDEICFVSIEKMDCSCKAGTSHTCKHIVAVLLFCNRTNVDSLELLSSTDVKCLWKRYQGPMLEQFESQPTKTFCCIKQERLKPLPEQVQIAVKRRLIECDKNTAVAKHYYRKKRNLSHRSPLLSIENLMSHQSTSASADVQQQTFVPQTNHQADLDLITKCVLDNSLKSQIISALKSKSVEMQDCCKKLYSDIVACKDAEKVANDTHTNKADWLKERKYRITGSRCYSIYTYNGKKWEDKARNYFWAKPVRNKYTAHGIKFEPVARDVYKNNNKCMVHECGLIVCHEEPWLAYSPDGIVIVSGQPTKLLEIKCPYELENTADSTLLAKCKFLAKDKNHAINLKKKHAYYGQVQLGMALLNLPSCDFVIYSNVSSTIKILKVEYDEKFCHELLSRLKTRYFEIMIHEVCKNSRLMNRQLGSL